MVFQKGHKPYNTKREEAPMSTDDEIEALFAKIEDIKVPEEKAPELPVPPTPPPELQQPEDDVIVTEVLMDDGAKDKVGFAGKVKKTERGDGFGFMQKRKMDGSPTSIYLITMLFGNGTMKHLVIEGKGNIFTYNKRKYHLNKALCWYDVNYHQNRLLFFEDYVEPLNNKLHCVGDRRFLSVTPDNIQEMLEMEYVKVLAQSQQLSRWLKIAVFLMIANLAISGINTLVFILQSGVLRGIAGG